MSSAYGILFRRTSANLLDCTIEISGGFLGSYFGMMMAALFVSVKDGPADQMQHSMWSGFGFGLVFWTFSLSFLNRVLIQGLSRSSIGKKFFGLELISVGKPLTWHTMVGRWVMGFGSFGVFGLGYLAAFLNKENRTLHDIACFTDVVPIYVGHSMSVEYREPEPLQMGSFVKEVRHQPMATVIQMPRPTLEVMPAFDEISAEPKVETLADVIDLSAERTRKTGTDDDSGSGSEAA
jgi:hypothetical protein